MHCPATPSVMTERECPEYWMEEDVYARTFGISETKTRSFKLQSSGAAGHRQLLLYPEAKELHWHSLLQTNEQSVPSTLARSWW